MISEVAELLSESVSHLEDSNISPMNSQFNNQVATRIADLNDRIILKKINNGEYPEAQTLLKQLQSIIKNTNYGDNKLTMYYHLSIYEYNYACVYQKLWKNTESRIHLERSLEYQKQQINQYNRDQDKIERKLQLIKCYLQYCAILSQLGNHDQSLQISKSIITLQKQIFTRCLKYCEDYYSRNPNRTIQVSSGIRFESLLINEAYQKLTYLSKIPEADDVLQQYREKFQNISQSIYFWKNTPQNNQKLLRKQLGISNGGLNPIRNVLGIKKNEQWIQSFNIGSAMMMKARTIDTKNKLESDFLYIISSKTLLQQIFYTSIAYFTIATQIRFKQVDNETKNLKANQKTIKMVDNQYVKICKIFHLKAIELVGKYVSSQSQYINHLILSFNKNYKTFMDAINQESVLGESKISNLHKRSKIHIEEEKFTKNPLNNDLVKTKNNTLYDQQILKYSIEATRKKSTNERIRSNTKNSQQPKTKIPPNMNKRIERSKSSNRYKRIQRLKSEPLYKSREQIKTFTFKIVKQIKSNCPQPVQVRKEKLPKKNNHKF